MLARLATLLADVAERYVPSAFAIAVLLTGVTCAGALAIGATPGDTVVAWGRGFWTLSSFAMQMALVVLTGFLVSTAPPVDRLFRAVARLAGPPARAVTLMAVVSMALAWLHWGLSLIGSAMLVRHIVRQQPRVDFRLLVTAAYLGMGATWHAGMSGSVPLLMATPGHFLEATTGRVPLSATTFAPFNLVLSLLVFVVMAGVVWWMHPPADQAVRVSNDGLDDLERFEPPPAPTERSFAAWCDHTRVLPLALGAMGAAWLVWYVRATGPQLTLDVLNFTFLMIAIVLHGRLSSVMAAGEQGSRLLAGVLLQFPLYAGMYGIIEGTGLARVLGDAIARSASADTLPLALYWYSSVLNYFVPSGGSKWAVEAPFIIDAAGRLGVGLDEVILAYAWGDMASNLIQPFWALPLLAAARLGFRDIMGYAAVCFVVVTVLASTAFWLLPLTR
ncbi:MAG: short-chain fatty acid transporter [Acidobacteria bacterium]|nr:short-chain fatty acid transporter [Acidobacteriota bacterium]